MAGTAPFNFAILQYSPRNRSLALRAEPDWVGYARPWSAKLQKSQHQTRRLGLACLCTMVLLSLPFEKRT
jgi:hypothetical protein